MFLKFRNKIFLIFLSIENPTKNSSFCSSFLFVDSKNQNRIENQHEFSSKCMISNLDLDLDEMLVF